MIVAKHELAARAGAEVMAEGGNAVDAAVTAGFAIAVLEPHQNSLGGAGYMVYRPVDGEPVAIEFTGRSPRAIGRDAFNLKPGERFGGPLAVGVPGTVSGLAIALERFGTISLRRAIEPALRLAADGMPINFMLHLRITQELEAIRSNPDSARTFLVDGDPPLAHGVTRLEQPGLARTLASIAAHGPEAFYTGRIAAETVRSVQARGGVLAESDLADYQAQVLPVLRGRYGDYDLLTVPPPSPGLTTVETLQLLDGFDLASSGHNSIGTLHLIAEACRLAFADRDAYLGDPDFGDIPTAQLLSAEYIERRRAEIRDDRALAEVRPGEVGVRARGQAADGAESTTQICVVDAAGNVVSQTQTCIGTISGFGVAGSTGVLMGYPLQWFDTRSDAPNSLEPGKRPLTNMTPMIVERDGRPVLSVGAPGSRRITNAVAQVALNVMEFGMGPQEAISAPRIDLSTGKIDIDDRINEDVIEGLRRLGHEVNPVHEFLNFGGPELGHHGFTGYFARPAAIQIDPDGTRHGGDYPFYLGEVVAVEEE